MEEVENMEGGVGVTVTVLLLGSHGSGKSRLKRILCPHSSYQNMYASSVLQVSECDTSSNFKLRVVDACSSESAKVICEQVREIHWLFIIINGQERISRSDFSFLDIPNFLLLKKTSACHVKICVTRSEGWNDVRRNKFLEVLQDSGMYHDLCENLRPSGGIPVLFCGAPDPDEMETADDQAYARRKEANARALLLHHLAETVEAVDLCSPSISIAGIPHAHGGWCVML
jgi:hypothetical protein